MNAIYTRQSLDIKDSLSIETQLAACMAENGDAPCRHYNDKGFSGKDTKRPAFHAMMQDVAAARVVYGSGAPVDTVTPDINFVTNTQTYKNGPDGTAFAYGDRGVDYTFTTWLKAPETGTYQLKVETIGATSAQANIVRDDGREQPVNVGLGNDGVGGFGNMNAFIGDTGLAIPHTGQTLTSGLYPQSSDFTSHLPPSSSSFSQESL